MQDILIGDNFFSHPELIRELALSYNDYRHSEDPEYECGWKGWRTPAPKAINEGIWDVMKRAYLIKEKDYICTPYFHISYEDTKLTCDFPNHKWHIDQSDYAGVVYLHPEPPKKTGTCLLDGTNNEIVTVDNVFNRVLAYPSHYYHAPEDLFGDSKDKESGRMTLTFFIWANDNPHKQHAINWMRLLETEK